MKKLMAIAVLLCCAAFAKKVPQPLITEYNHTGYAVHSFKMNEYNSEAHVTVGNDTYSAYCNVGESSADCSDHPFSSGTHFVLENEDKYGVSPLIGHQLGPIRMLVTLDGRTGTGHELRFIDACLDSIVDRCDPLAQLYWALETENNGVAKIPFQYRDRWHRISISEDTQHLVCVPFVLTNKKGEVKHHGEACYW